MKRFLTTAIASTAIAVATMTMSWAEDRYVVGVSAGLTGYATTVDRAWVEGVKIGVEEINAKGGLLGKQLQAVVEDNRSEPQEAVSSYRKMLSADNAQVFLSACLSSGNFAGAPIVVRQKIPMVVCSILPKEENLRAWMYSLMPAPRFEVETRLAYLQDKTSIRQVGILYDQSPYAGALLDSVMEEAEKYGVKIVGAEQYQQNDADFSVVLKKLYADGARAILKMGTGPSTMTMVRNIKSLSLDLPVLTSSDDTEVLKAAAEVMGERLLFVASLTQVYDSLPDSEPLKAVMAPFIKEWRKNFGTRDTLFSARGYDATKILAAAVTAANSFDGEKVRDAINELSDFQGSASVYNFSENRMGVVTNPYVMGQFVDGKLTIVK